MCLLMLGDGGLKNMEPAADDVTARALQF